MPPLFKYDDNMEFNLNIQIMHLIIRWKKQITITLCRQKVRALKLRQKKWLLKLYHCIYDNKVFLFYKDEESLLHCYEVENPEAVKEIAQNPSELDNILRKRASIN